MARLLWIAVVVGACSNRQPQMHDARLDDVGIVDAPPDAAIDAAVDAPPDAPPDAPLPMSTCQATVSVLADVAPSRVSGITSVANTLYIGAYDYDPVTGDSNARLLTYDLTTGMPTAAPVTFQSRPMLWVGDGEAWLTDYNGGSIWRLQPGVAPELVLSGRPQPGVVVADGGYVYWSESVPPSTQQTAIRRRLITGGTVEPVTTCDGAIDLRIAGNDLYCAAFLDGDLLRAPKAGGPAVSIPLGASSYPMPSMTRDGTDIFFVTLKPTAEVYRVPLPNGPATLVHEMTTPTRFVGIAVSPTFIFITGDSGVRRIHRATKTVQTSYAGGLADGDPVFWSNELIFVKKDSQVLRCVDGGT